MAEYIHRNIDLELTAWKEDSMRKPLLLRGAQTGWKIFCSEKFRKTIQVFRRGEL